MHRDREIEPAAERAHRKRNLAEYEGHLDVTLQLIEATIRVASELERRLDELAPLE